MRSTAPPCIVLAGGLGTRLREAIAGRPKGLAPVGARDFLEIQIDSLRAQGIGDIVLALGHQAEAVIDAVRGWRDASGVRWVVEPRPLGTGGAAAHAMDALHLGEALVANGDTFLSGDLAAMLAPLRRGDGEAMRMAIVHVPDRRRFGGVRLDGVRVAGFSEKGEQGAGDINAGLYRVSRDALRVAAGEAFSIETAVMPALAVRGVLWAARIDGEFIDIGVPEDYRRFCERAAP